MCNDPTFTGGLVQDKTGYLFRGNYFWTFDFGNGFGGLKYAKRIDSKWPEIKGFVRTVFTVSKSNALINILVVVSLYISISKQVFNKFID